MIKRLSLFAALLLVVASCQKQMSSGIQTAHMDTSVAADNDFYAYTNGTWLETFDIPADKSNYGMFTKLADEAEVNLRKIIEEASANREAEKGSDHQKIGDYYNSFMDTVKIEELGITPIVSELEAIDAVTTREELTGRFGELRKVGLAGPFAQFVSQDGKNSEQYITYVTQTGLSLPDRSYYLSDNPRFVEIREKFVAHMQRMFEMAGIDDAEARAKRIMEMETAMAEKHWTRVENRDRDKTYNKMSFAALQELTPDFDWTAYLTKAAMPVEEVDSVVVRQPSYMEAANDIYTAFTVEDWKTYLKWSVLSATASLLSDNFVEEDFDFFRRTLSGVQEQRPRWKRGVDAVAGAMGELVGRVYVQRHFKPEAKQRMEVLVANLKDSFRDRINGLEWMTDETKQKALEKLEKFNSKIGYPDKWKDYSALEVEEGDLVGNSKRASIWSYMQNVDKLGKPIDRDEWFMTPQTVNAYYSPSMNEIVFPAAILQPPFFNMEADDAVNYGAIGAVIGHELTHGFDDQGRKSDGNGNLIDWWTAVDAERFEERAQIMVEQYNQYNPIDTMHVNGKLTLGENIADLGGLTIAYYAYKKSLQGQEAPVIDGFSGDQRFFMGWAQIWARKYRDDELRQRLKTDPHSPGRYRTNGIVANMPEFYAAFNVDEGDGHFRPEDKRVKIW